MKKVIVIISIITIILSGCASIKYRGWDMVRVEYEKPNIECVHKGWGMCSYSYIDSQLWHRKRAVRVGANLIVFRPEIIDGRRSNVSSNSKRKIDISNNNNERTDINDCNVYNSKSSYGGRIIRTADYYYCKKYSEIIKE